MSPLGILGSRRGRASNCFNKAAKADATKQDKDKAEETREKMLGRDVAVLKTEGAREKMSHAHSAIQAKALAEGNVSYATYYCRTRPSKTSPWGPWSQDAMSVGDVSKAAAPKLGGFGCGYWAARMGQGGSKSGAAALALRETVKAAMAKATKASPYNILDSDGRLQVALAATPN